MCEANAYMEKEGREELILESVDFIEPQPDEAYRLVSIFGEQKIIHGRLKEMRLVDHRIVFTA